MGNIVYGVKSHIVCDCRYIADNVVLFAKKEDAQDNFKTIVQHNKNSIKKMELDYIVEVDNDTMFDAGDIDLYHTNHICIELLEIEVK